MPPLTPEQLAEASTRLDGLTQKLEKTILDDICRRIAKAGTVTDTAEWQMLRLKEMGYANDIIEQAVSDYTKKSAAEVQQLFHEAAQVSDIFYSEMYTQSGKPFVPVDENPYMQQLITAAADQTKNELVNLTQSMGFAVRQPDGSVAFQPAAKAYQSALDLAQMQVATGTFDYTSAIRNSVKALTDSGLQFVDYASGHRNRADVAARRAILTGLSQMTGKVAERNANELETDIVEVTAHAGARPDHAEWQGRRYSLSGKSKEYPSLEEATGYGMGDGLKGWNCRHDFYPVIPGISPPAYTEEQLANIDPPPIEYNGKTLTYYECTQKQRAMETAMRKTKREIIAAKASGDDDMFTAKSIRLRRQKEEYAKFSDKAGLLTQNERTQVYGFDKSISAKAAWAVKKAANKNILTNASAQAKINIGNNSLRQCKKFDDLEKYLAQKYNISMDASVKTLNFKAVKKSVTGIEMVIKEFPQLNGVISSLGTSNDGIMSAEYSGKINFNPFYYKDLKTAQKASISHGYHPKRNNIVTTGSHEAGHIIEKVLIDKSTGGGALGTIMWNDCTYAKAVVHEACVNLKNSAPKGQKQTFYEMKGSVSSYAKKNDSECLAECIADYMRNRKRASPLSLEVVKILKRELSI
ncbi:MAG: phage minor capsid protein [Oscillospiraceae bacterium]